MEKTRERLAAEERWWLRWKPSWSGLEAAAANDLPTSLVACSGASLGMKRGVREQSCRRRVGLRAEPDGSDDGNLGVRQESLPDGALVHGEGFLEPEGVDMVSVLRSGAWFASRVTARWLY